MALLRSGRLLRAFSDLAEGCYTAGFKEFPFGHKQRIAGVAFRCAEHGSLSRFVLFAATGESYELILRQEAPLGALGIWGNPRRLHIFSARTALDLGESCLYCLHRYTIKDFAWKRGHFKQVAEETPQYVYNPNRLVEHPFFDSDYP